MHFTAVDGRRERAAEQSGKRAIGNSAAAACGRLPERWQLSHSC